MENKTPEEIEKTIVEAPTRKRKTRGPTIRERKLIKGLIAGKSVIQSALDAGYSPENHNANSARVSAHEALRKPTVRAEFERALENAGLTQDKLASELKNGLDRGRKGSHFDYLKLACKLKGLDVDEAAQAQAPTVGVLVNIVRDSAQTRGLPL